MYIRVGDMAPYNGCSNNQRHKGAHGRSVKRTVALVMCPMQQGRSPLAYHGLLGAMEDGDSPGQQEDRECSAGVQQTRSLTKATSADACLNVSRIRTRLRCAAVWSSGPDDSKF